MTSDEEPNDELIRSEWQGREPARLVFILGLHRSGTTFLYESMSQVFAVTKLTISDVVNFDHLIWSHRTDGGRADRDTLARYFDATQTRTRGNDALPLSPSTAEEYGWVLKQKFGSYRASDLNVRALRDLISKLAYLRPNDHAVLLKNPWDTGNGPYLAKRFPEARFIFIRREPIEILNSELGNLLHFSGRPDALLTLLTKNIKGTRLFITVVRLLRLALGTRLFARLGIRLLAADVVSKLESYDKALLQMPRDRAIEVTYGDLTEDPQRILRDIGRFLGLIPSNNVYSIVASRRSGGILPLVRSHERKLRARLARAGLATIRAGS